MFAVDHFNNCNCSKCSCSSDTVSASMEISTAKQERRENNEDVAYIFDSIQYLCISTMVCSICGYAYPGVLHSDERDSKSKGTGTGRVPEESMEKLLEACVEEALIGQAVQA